jgi:hypothetical protein
VDLIRDSLIFVWDSARDVAPIVIFLFAFQLFVIRARIPNLRRILVGFVFVTVGLGLFLVGLEQTLFPLGRLMAQQLTNPDFLYEISGHIGETLVWQDFYWVYLFAAAIGFSTTLAEPALMAVAIKANTVSGGAIGIWALRVAVAIGAGIGVALGCYDSGGVTTSTVTVPLITALGLGLAEAVPGRSPLLDGFGLVAFAALFPIISVLAYGQLAARKQERARSSEQNRELPEETDHAL